MSFALSAGAGSKAPDVDLRLEDEEAKLELLNERLGLLNDELSQLDSKQTTLLGELHRFDIQIRLANKQLELLALELKRGYREIDENLELIQALEASIAELLPYLKSRSVSLYKQGRLSYLRLLLSVEKPSELTRAYRYVSRLAREDGKKMSRFLDDQKALEDTKARLLKQTAATLLTRKELQAATRTLASRRESRATLLGEIESRREMAGTLVYELERAREQLSALLETLSAGEPMPETATVHIPMRVFQGELGWPLDGKVEGRFGTELHPRFKTVTVRNGIELGAPLGTPVGAVYGGEVAFAAWFEGYGKLLILRHPGNVHSLYGYLDEFTVSPGDWVEQGQPVASVGETGSLAGVRLYFEIRFEGVPVDPETWLDPSRKVALLISDAN